MTNPTPPGQVPDALRLADECGYELAPGTREEIAAELLRLHAENEALRAQQDDAYDHGPQAETVEEAARDVGKWLNERPNRPLDLRHVAMLTHHAKRTAHVQSPAENEHVAGDVSKNGAELNMSTQQPAPAGAMATWAAVQEHYETLADFQEGQWWVNELDAMASHPIGQTIRVTPDMLRAVAVVHNLLRAAATPQPAPAGATPDATWCAYVAGMICTYLKEDADGAKAKAIAGIIERRLMFLAATPQPAPATQQAGVSDDAILAAARNWGEVQQYTRGDGKGTEHRITFNVHQRAAHFARELLAALQPSPTAQAASSAVLKAIREANMQLVRTGDNAFMLVPYKVATAQAAESVPAGPKRKDMLWSTAKMQERHDQRIENIVSGLERIKQEHAGQKPQKIDECYGDCPADPTTCTNPCSFDGRAARARLLDSDLSNLTERGAKAWAGVDAQKLREDGTT